MHRPVKMTLAQASNTPVEKQLKEHELNKLRASLYQGTAWGISSSAHSAALQQQQQQQPGAARKQQQPEPRQQQGSSLGDKYFSSDRKFRAIDILRLLDTDGDGYISRTELRAMYARGSVDDRAYQEAQRAFDVADRDGNGVLDVREFKRLLISASPTRRELSPLPPQRAPQRGPQRAPRLSQELPAQQSAAPQQQQEEWLKLAEQAALAEERAAAAERKAEARAHELAELALKLEAERRRAAPSSGLAVTGEAVADGSLQSPELAQQQRRRLQWEQQAGEKDRLVAEEESGKKRRTSEPRARLTQLQEAASPVWAADGGFGASDGTVGGIAHDELSRAVDSPERSAFAAALARFEAPAQHSSRGGRLQSPSLREAAAARRAAAAGWAAGAEIIKKWTATEGDSSSPASPRATPTAPTAVPVRPPAAKMEPSSPTASQARRAVEEEMAQPAPGPAEAAVDEVDFAELLRLQQQEHAVAPSPSSSPSSFSSRIAAAAAAAAALKAASEVPPAFGDGEDEGEDDGGAALAKAEAEAEVEAEVAVEAEALMEGEAKMEELGPLPSRLTRDETTLRLRSPDLRLVPHQSQRVLLSSHARPAAPTVVPDAVPTLVAFVSAAPDAGAAPSPYLEELRAYKSRVCAGGSGCAGFAAAPAPDTTAAAGAAGAADQRIRTSGGREPTPPVHAPFDAVAASGDVGRSSGEAVAAAAAAITDGVGGHVAAAGEQLSVRRKQELLRQRLSIMEDEMVGSWEEGASEGNAEGSEGLEGAEKTVSVQAAAKEKAARAEERSEAAGIDPGENAATATSTVGATATVRGQGDDSVEGEDAVEDVAAMDTVAAIDDSNVPSPSVREAELASLRLCLQQLQMSLALSADLLSQQPEAEEGGEEGDQEKEEGGGAAATGNLVQPLRRKITSKMMRAEEEMSTDEEEFRKIPLRRKITSKMMRAEEEMSTDEEEKPRRKITMRMMRAEEEENYEEDGDAEEDDEFEAEMEERYGFAAPRPAASADGGMGDLNEALGALRRLLLRLAVHSPPEEEFEEANGLEDGTVGHEVVSAEGAARWGWSPRMALRAASMLPQATEHMQAMSTALATSRLQCLQVGAALSVSQLRLGRVAATRVERLLLCRVYHAWLRVAREAALHAETRRERTRVQRALEACTEERLRRERVEAELAAMREAAESVIDRLAAPPKPGTVEAEAEAEAWRCEASRRWANGERGVASARGCGGSGCGGSGCGGSGGSMAGSSAGTSRRSSGEGASGSGAGSFSSPAWQLGGADAVRVGPTLWVPALPREEGMPAWRAKSSRSSVGAAASSCAGAPGTGAGASKSTRTSSFSAATTTPISLKPDASLGDPPPSSSVSPTADVPSIALADSNTHAPAGSPAPKQMSFRRVLASGPSEEPVAATTRTFIPAPRRQAASKQGKLDAKPPARARTPGSK